MMQSAFAYPQFKADPYDQWGAVVPGILYGQPPQAAPMQQQQQAQQGFPSSGGGVMHPVTPQAAADTDANFNHLWQAATAVGGGLIGDDSLDPEGAEMEEEEEEPARKRKGKGKKGAGRRDIDKLAKQEQRMIKNRESAARSRLRRQQHTAQLEQENEELKGQVAALTEKVDQLKGQVADLEWQLTLTKVPHNMPRASITVSRTQHSAGISALPAAPSISLPGLSLPAANSLMLPQLPAQLVNPHDLGAVEPQDALAGIVPLDGFEFAYTSRRGSSYA